MRVDLAGVPETALWTLYHRALEARRPDAVLADPLAVELVERLDYPFAERFGEGRGVSQWQALRAATFDREVRRFAVANPMYFPFDEVQRLVTGCVRRFPRGALVFDAVPAWLAGRPSPPGSPFQRPPWEWGMDAARERALAALVAELRALRPPRGRGPVHGLLLPLAWRVPALRRLMLSVYAARFTS
jgi:O-methyltransferase involved in polyketide biosynthesis